MSAQQDGWGLRVAAMAAENSRDPSTQTGCVVLDTDWHIVGVGWNAFPRGVEVTDERLNNRALKYPMMVHAEMNALLRAGNAVRGSTLYCYPWPPCADCAGAIIQSGVVRVVAPQPTPEQEERWGESFKIMQIMFSEAGVVLDTVAGLPA